MKRMALIVGICSISLLGACNTNDTKVATQEDEQLIAEGETITKTSCIGCHGIDLKGDMGPNLHQLTLSKEEIIEVLQKGRGSMPAATAKGHEEAVATYLLSLK